ncbi:MAG: hypothetical protein M0R06_17195 [Sphaerochaeta sp.]|jgi:hypothetical protein|nr:hypothetical protein [Sphaerochaeta sp.]
MIYLLLAVLLDRVQFKLCAKSYGNLYCGYGTIDSVNNRTALSPMAYRVLVPWLIASVEAWRPSLKTQRLPALYEPLKIGLMALMLYSVDLALGREGTLLFCVLLGVTFYFDYFDFAPEVMALALALTGDVRLALLGGLFAALARETAPLGALTYILVTGDVGRGLQVFAAICAILLAVRLWVGHKKLYCERVLWRVNIQDVHKLFVNRPFYLSEISMSLLASALTLYAIVSGHAGAAWPVPLLLLGLGWTLARASETRVFSGCLLWVAMAL